MPVPADPVVATGRTSPPAGSSRVDPAGPDDCCAGRRCEVLLRPDLDRQGTVISVAGPLGRSGGALLAAVLEYVCDREDGTVRVDLRGVTHAERSGVTPLLEFGATLAGTSAPVDAALAGACADIRTRQRARGTAGGRPARPGAASRPRGSDDRAVSPYPISSGPPGPTP